MAGATYSISSPDLTEQVKRLGVAEVERVVNKHAFPAMQRSVVSMKEGWKQVAAFKEGIYRGTLKMEIKEVAGGRFLQGSIRTFAMSPRGFPYPRALEDSVRYHYRSTRQQGRRTAGQVASMFKNRMPQYRKLFRKANDLIVKDLAVK